MTEIRLYEASNRWICDYNQLWEAHSTQHLQQSREQLVTRLDDQGSAVIQAAMACRPALTYPGVPGPAYNHWTNGQSKTTHKSIRKVTEVIKGCTHYSSGTLYLKIIIRRFTEESWCFHRSFDTFGCDSSAICKLSENTLSLGNLDMFMHLLVTPVCPGQCLLNQCLSHEIRFRFAARVQPEQSLRALPTS